MPTLHPRAFSASLLCILLPVSVLGAAIGIHLVTTLGVVPGTSLLGALLAMLLARMPMAHLRSLRSKHAQNLVQTSMSSATFGAAISLLAPLGLPYVMGLSRWIPLLLAGTSLAMLWDAFMLYRLFGSTVFPATAPWPLGLATAEIIEAGDAGGRKAGGLAFGLVVGVTGSMIGLPMAALGVAFLGGLSAMFAFAAGLLSELPLRMLASALDGGRGTEGILLGAGAVAALQCVGMIRPRRGRPCQDFTVATPLQEMGDRAGSMRRVLGVGGLGYLLIAMLLAGGTGLYASLSLAMLIGFILFAALSALAHELIVGLAAMHTGWAPSFGVALVTLLLGLWIGFPTEAVVVLTGFTSATGPAFADMGYDLKAGFLLRGRTEGAFEQEGQRQQLLAAGVGFAVAIIAVTLTHQTLFAQGRIAPISMVYAAAIKAYGEHTAVVPTMLAWAGLGAGLQLLGGVKRQWGIMFATGLLVASPAAGGLILLGLACRLGLPRRRAWTQALEPFAGGIVAGDVLCSFGLAAGGTLPLSNPASSGPPHH